MEVAPTKTFRGSYFHGSFRGSFRASVRNFFFRGSFHGSGEIFHGSFHELPRKTQVVQETARAAAG